MQDLMEQAKEARFLFDAADEREFSNRIGNRRHISRDIYRWSDRQLLNLITRMSRVIGKRFRLPPYKLPKHIHAYLERQTKILNSSLCEVTDGLEVPKQYL